MSSYVKLFQAQWYLSDRYLTMFDFYHNPSSDHTPKVDIHINISLLREILWSLCTNKMPKLSWKKDLEKLFTEMLIQGGRKIAEE